MTTVRKHELSKLPAYRNFVIWAAEQIAKQIDWSNSKICATLYRDFRKSYLEKYNAYETETGYLIFSDSESEMEFIIEWS